MEPEAVMDISEGLIVFLLAAGLAWALYNWTHPAPHVK
jgi:hypothetical protein